MKRQMQKERKMNKLFVLLPLALILSACGGKTELAPRAYMPAPPEILMRKPKDLNTIKPPSKPEETEEKKNEEV